MKRDRFIHIGRLERAVPSRKPGIREAYMKVGKPVTIRGQPFWQVAEADYQSIRKEFALPKPVSVTVGRDSSTAGGASLGRAGFEPSKPPTLPSLTISLKNAATAATRVITAAANGQPIQVPDAEFQRRMTICEGCENYIKETQRCAKCACYLTSQVIGKARLATETCPICKWGKPEA